MSRESLTFSARARSSPRRPTPVQRAAVLFVAALAENVDANRGVVAPNGTPETRALVAAEVRERFFEPSLTFASLVLSPLPELAGQGGTVVDLAPGVAQVQWPGVRSWHKVGELSVADVREPCSRPDCGRIRQYKGGTMMGRSADGTDPNWSEFAVSCAKCGRDWIEHTHEGVIWKISSETRGTP